MNKVKYFSDIEDITGKEASRMNWLVGFFIGTHVVTRTFKKRPEWDKEKIIKNLQGEYFDVVYIRFLTWMHKRYEKNDRQDDVKLQKLLNSSSEMQLETKRCMHDKIPLMAKKYNDERNGLTTRRLIKGPVEGWNKIVRHFENRCAYCESNGKITMDHVIPITKGGTHEAKNVLPACKSCNSSKNANDLNIWFPNQTFYSNKRAKKIRIHLSMEGAND